MSTRAVGWLVWSLCGLSVAAAAAGTALFLQSGHVPRGAPVDVGGPGLVSIDMVVFAAVGALIASRRPSNPVGWLLLVVGLTATIGLNGLGYGYAYDSLEGPTGPLPAASWLAWLTAWMNTGGIWAAALALQLFPTGRPVSPRWWPLVWFMVGVATLVTLVQALRPGPIENFPEINNPLGLPGAAGALASAVYELSGGLPFGPAALVLGPPAILIRLWHARGAERQQLKWIVYAWTIVPLYFVLLIFGASFWPDLGRMGTPPAFVFWSVGWAIAIAALPVSIGIAILRYRLYEIDLIIRRTLVYGTVTAMLAGLFAALSIVSQRLVLVVAGQESQAAVVLAALVVTALFQPLRSRVQTVVDRRFYRRKYDATRTLERFASQIRDEVELDRLTAGLVTVVRETMQPAYASLWLRPIKRKL